MICPQCGVENIAGADECSNCKQDLTYFDQPSVAAGSAVERALMEQPVRVLDPTPPISVRADTPLRQVIQTLIDKKIGCVLVMDGAELVGIFTERDVLMNIAGRESELANDPIREWMTPNPETVEEDDSIAFAIHKMDIGGYRHLPVMEAGTPTGVISIRDVVRHLAGYLSPAAL
jgi:predicted transcriptional regulator